MTKQATEHKKIEIDCEECVMPVGLSEEDQDTTILKCVRCPFCKQSVNAMLTITHITCPKCHVSVKI